VLRTRLDAPGSCVARETALTGINFFESPSLN
jgi:hypothetical protein